MDRIVFEISKGTEKTFFNRFKLKQIFQGKNVKLLDSSVLTVLSSPVKSLLAYILAILTLQLINVLE